MMNIDRDIESESALITNHKYFNFNNIIFIKNQRHANSNGKMCSRIEEASAQKNDCDME